MKSFIRENRSNMALLLLLVSILTIPNLATGIPLFVVFLQTTSAVAAFGALYFAFNSTSRNQKIVGIISSLVLFFACIAAIEVLTPHQTNIGTLFQRLFLP